MNGGNDMQGKILVVSPMEGFLERSVIKKIEEQGFSVSMFHGAINELEKERDQIELVILFMSEGIEDMTDRLVYLKDMMNDLDRRMIVIGETSEYEHVLKTIPEMLILRWFKRPLSMDDLMQCVLRYMEENTGEKRKKTILIVDDDITYMRTVYEWLKDTYHVGMAGSGIQAISYLAKNQADLVLLDYEMPIADGPQVLSMLKNDSETDQIPVMFLTGHGDRESVMSVVGLKPADYLLKTIDKQGLLDKLEEFFKRRNGYI